MRRQGFRVFRPPEAGEAIRHIARTSPVYNIRSGLYTLTQLLDNIHQHNYDVVIFERGIFDAYCWMQFWADKKQLTPAARKITQDFLLLDYWSKAIDRVYFLTCDPQQALERELRHSLSKQLPADNLKTVKLYQHGYTKLAKRFSQLKLIDTTKRSSQAVTELSAGDILALMATKTKPKR